MGSVIIVIQMKNVVSADAATKAQSVASEVAKILGAEVVSKEYREDL